MTTTYDALATQTLGSSASSITFSSISGSYTDLILVTSPIASVTTGQIAIRFNGDTGNNYSRTILWGNGSSAGSYKNSNEPFAYTGYYTNIWTTPTINVFHINNYSNTASNKTVLGRSNNVAEAAMASINLWRSTAAITSISLTIADGSSYSAGSTFTLYGIKAE